MVKDMNAVQLDCMHLAAAQAQVPDVDPDDEMEFLSEVADGSNSSGTVAGRKSSTRRGFRRRDKLRHLFMSTEGRDWRGGPLRASATQQKAAQRLGLGKAILPLLSSVCGLRLAFVAWASLCPE